LSVDVANLVLGPCDLYIGPYMAAEPPDSAVTPNGPTNPPGSPFIDVGGTDGGVTFEVDSEFTELTVDQIIMGVGARMTGVKMSVTAKLAEVTLSNISQALNQLATPAAGAGYSTLDIPVGKASTQPKYACLLIDGWAPELPSGEPALRRLIVRKVLSTAKVALAYDKKTQQSLDCTWNVYFVSDSIVPVHIVDQEE
jgi:hypothetical protein